MAAEGEAAGATGTAHGGRRGSSRPIRVADGPARLHAQAERTRSDLLAYYAQLPRGEGFGNGREARRTFETMVAEHANRLARSGTHTAEELTTLLPEDLPDEWTDRSAAMA
ncbi:hypothetical protein [Phytohabitans aurantiacus]|uniref:CbbX AAA lid domain-containing protein n=1 Tax=Phytohabitans aurantiacus TaxID=3016789 RepID=A0ABQ5R1A1_9ACTN|nr:hypothetical protein [Phytohabitans aurantiacus]GLH99345.1 hypothetical protein Pa4123_46200 [Phytohabitans aurantiacus]